MPPMKSITRAISVASARRGLRRETQRRWLAACMIFHCFCGTVAPACAAVGAVLEKTPESNPSPDRIREAIDRARKKIADRDIEGAARDLAVVDARRFTKLRNDEQRSALSMAARSAISRNDSQNAHRWSVRATSVPGATARDWLTRIDTAIRQKDFVDSAQSSLRMFERWPREFADLPPHYLTRTLRVLKTLPAHDVARRRILAAVTQTHFPTSDGGPGSAGLGALFVETALQYAVDRDAQRASQTALRIEDPVALIAARADRRLTEIVRANEQHFDIDRALALDIHRERAQSEVAARSLQARGALVLTLLRAGDYAQALKVSGDAVATMTANPQAFDDTEQQASWMLEYHADALMAHGNWDQAAEQLRRAAAYGEKAGVTNINQSINLSSYYCELARGDDALVPLATMREGLSEFGKVQLEGVRLCAAVLRNDQDTVERALAYLKEHRDDEPRAYQSALVMSNRLDEAAAWLVTRLADPLMRYQALLGVQSYRNAPQVAPFMAERRRRWSEVLARPEVQAQVAAVGNVQSYNVDVRFD